MNELNRARAVSFAAILTQMLLDKPKSPVTVTVTEVSR